MDLQVVFGQMLMIFILMMVGYYLTKKGMLSKITSQQISGIIVNICNPAIVLMSAFDENTTATNQDILMMALVSMVSFLVLILLGRFMGPLVKAKKEEYRYYNLMTVFGNTAFIGIPVVSAVLGGGAVIYVAVFNIFFNIIIYSYGIYILTKGTSVVSKEKAWKKMINAGTLSGVIAIVVFMLKLPVPTLIKDSVGYMGRATTFLSMIVLGASLARMKWKDVFREYRIYPFAFVRLLLVPIASALVFKQILRNETILGVIVLLMAMPMANMPLMLANKYELKTDVLAKGIVLTTLLSLITITIVAFFV